MEKILVGVPLLLNQLCVALKYFYISYTIIIIRKNIKTIVFIDVPNQKTSDITSNQNL